MALGGGTSDSYHELPVAFWFLGGGPSAMAISRTTTYVTTIRRHTM